MLLLPLFEIRFLFTSLVCILAQHGLQNKGHAETPDFPVATSSSRLCHGKSVMQALLYRFIFCHLINRWGLMFFSAIPMVSLLEADDDTHRSVSAGQGKNNTTIMLCCTTLMQLELE